jgi:hypothetical protein
MSHIHVVPESLIELEMIPTNGVKIDFMPLKIQKVRDFVKTYNRSQRDCNGLVIAI